MEELFRRYEANCGVVVLRDGIIAHEKWNASPIKLLFILKEYYKDQAAFKGNHATALRHWTLDNSTGCFFRSLFIWSLAVHNPDEKPPQDGYDSAQWETARSAFLKSAVINLKKVVGSSTSSDADIKKYVEKNVDVLKEQVLQINPDYVICGNTRKIIDQYLFSLTAVNEEDGVWINKDTGIYFIDENHPSHRKKQNYFYNQHGFVQQALHVNRSDRR